MELYQSKKAEEMESHKEQSPFHNQLKKSSKNEVNQSQTEIKKSAIVLKKSIKVCVLKKNVVTLQHKSQ